MRKRPERSLKPLDDLKNTVAEPEAYGINHQDKF